MSSKKGLKDAYSLKTPEDNINLYKIWASSYDDDFAKKNDFRSPYLISMFFKFLITHSFKELLFLSP